MASSHTSGAAAAGKEPAQPEPEVAEMLGKLKERGVFSDDRDVAQLQSAWNALLQDDSLKDSLCGAELRAHYRVTLAELGRGANAATVTSAEAAVLRRQAGEFLAWAENVERFAKLVRGPLHRYIGRQTAQIQTQLGTMNPKGADARPLTAMQQLVVLQTEWEALLAQVEMPGDAVTWSDRRHELTRRLEDLSARTRTALALAAAPPGDAAPVPYQQLFEFALLRPAGATPPTASDQSLAVEDGSTAENDLQAALYRIPRLGAHKARLKKLLS